MAELGYNKTRIDLDFELFLLPPTEDAMVIGTRAPIGKGAAKKIMDAAAPDQFEYVEVENNDLIEAILQRKRI
jgi:hypothetical protein